MVIKTPTRPFDFNRSSHSSSCWFQQVGAFIELLISTRCKLLIPTGWGWTCQFYWPHRGGRVHCIGMFSLNRLKSTICNLLKSTTRWMRRPVEISWSCWPFHNYVMSSLGNKNKHFCLCRKVETSLPLQQITFNQPGAFESWWSFRQPLSS